MRRKKRRRNKSRESAARAERREKSGMKRGGGEPVSSYAFPGKALGDLQSPRRGIGRGELLRGG